MAGIGGAGLKEQIKTSNCGRFIKSPSSEKDMRELQDHDGPVRFQVSDFPASPTARAVVGYEVLPAEQATQ